MQKENLSKEEIAKGREFKYRAFSPDSEPPFPQEEETRHAESAESEENDQPTTGSPKRVRQDS